MAQPQGSNHRQRWKEWQRNRVLETGAVKGREKRRVQQWPDPLRSIPCTSVNETSAAKCLAAPCWATALPLSCCICVLIVCECICVCACVCDAMCWRQAHIRVHTVELSPVGVESLKKEIPPLASSYTHTRTHKHAHSCHLYISLSPPGTSLMKPMLVCLGHMQLSWPNTTVCVCVREIVCVLGKETSPPSHGNIFSGKSQQRHNTAALPCLSPSVMCGKDIGRRGYWL